MTSPESPPTSLEHRRSTPSRPAPPSFATRLNRLFETVYPPGRGPFTSAELINALNATGNGISAPYLSQLRTGARVRPSRETIYDIAAFFRVSPAYFTDTSYYLLLEQELTVLAALRDPAVRRVVSRVLGLSAAAMAEIARTVDDLRDEEQLC